MTKLPKHNSIPVVGGQAETFACVYVMGAAGFTSVARLGYCLDPSQRLAVVSQNTFCDIYISSLFWLPDVHAAGRIVRTAREMLGDQLIRGEWFDRTPEDMEETVKAAAQKCHVPMLSNHQYRKLCRSPEQRRNIALGSSLKSVGISRR